MLDSYDRSDARFHCTGIEATYRLRESTGLDRKTAVVSATGSSFALGLGIDPRMLAH
jgi:7,8-dihydropterin-6-yl-methyl-4-(beta-D-ribofuranosyl)aminobenzene 5'-phosphate synthase